MERRPQDARWRPVIALLAVGLLIGSVAHLSPEEGWRIRGHAIRIAWPQGWPSLGPNAPSTPVVPRWKPEDIEQLLAQYDAQLSEAESGSDATNAGDAEPTFVGSSDSISTPADSAQAAEADAQPVEPSTSDASGPTASPDVPASAGASPQGSSPTSASPSAVPTASADWIPGALRIRIPEARPDLLDRLWTRLRQGQDIAVLHYGDSQIEGDRISGTLRARWQERWGGFGPGIQPPIPLVQSFALRQSHSESWKRHTRFGRRDTTDRDENYGLLASYADTDPAGAPPHCLGIATEPRSPHEFGMWTGVELWHDTVHVTCILSLGGQDIDTLEAGTLPGKVSLAGTSMMPGDPELELCFSAAPPRLFALHPEGSGVQWHSVAMRGSSGTLFRKLHRPTLARHLNHLDPDLIVLQFGGNSVPHCPDTAAAKRYAGWVKRQIGLFQSLEPQAAVLVIGPSDMAEKTGVDWTTYPMLSPLRDALLAASLDAGAAYWDLLGVMGGPGSMPAWVAAEPPLAGPDHVHFTPRGARKVGELLDRALWAEYRKWQQGSAPTPMQGMRPKSVQSLPVHESGN